MRAEHGYSPEFADSIEEERAIPQRIDALFKAARASTELLDRYAEKQEFDAKIAHKLLESLRAKYQFDQPTLDIFSERLVQVHDVQLAIDYAEQNASHDLHKYGIDEPTAEEAAAALAYEITGTTPQDHVTVTRYATHVEFTVDTLEDFAYMGRTSEDIANQASGWAFSRRRIPFTLAINNYPDQLDATRVHENQHVHNQLLFHRSEQSMPSVNEAAVLVRTNKQSAEKVTGNDPADLIGGIMAERYAPRVKDEIIAYLREGSDAEHIVETLTESPLYDYAEVEGEREDYMAFMKRDVVLSENADKLTNQVLERAKVRYHAIVRAWVAEAAKVQASTSRHLSQQESLMLLALTPMRRWAQLARVVKTITSPRPAIPGSAQQNAQQALDTYLKYESYDIVPEKKPTNRRAVSRRQLHE